MFYCEELDSDTDLRDYAHSKNQTELDGISIFSFSHHEHYPRARRRGVKLNFGLPARYVHSCHKTAAKSSAPVSETWRWAQAVLFLFSGWSMGEPEALAAPAVLADVTLPVSDSSPSLALLSPPATPLASIVFSWTRSDMTARRSASLNCFARFFNRCLRFSALRKSLVIFSSYRGLPSAPPSAR